ncbi:hypothetical protein KIKIMORA_01820 [Brevundimonas phage vB_BpoS-Kikimora]|uniref:Uncharacterized protein n=1 Tax=Brevundimonas phage vB_BpoS-Kikimora TaxID=2948601 RepID=A0A9E7MS11_9CAUD|nr:hypothetical protein KIKIMORA_01820 [Brevundimonas phage vB_BpoS-Kikimora]
MIRWFKRVILNERPSGPIVRPPYAPALAAQSARMVAETLRHGPNRPIAIHAHVLADVYDAIADLNEKVVAMEREESVRRVAQAWERSQQ